MTPYLLDKNWHLHQAGSRYSDQTWGEGKQTMTDATKTWMTVLTPPFANAYAYTVTMRQNIPVYLAKFGFSYFSDWFNK
jgi:hypothetical protein